MGRGIGGKRRDGGMIQLSLLSKRKRLKWTAWKEGEIIKKEYLKPKRHAKHIVYKA